MKKLIYSLGIAIAIGSAANAANPSMQMQKAMPLSNDVMAAELSQSNLTFERITPDTRKAKRAVSTAEDFVGMYKWEGRNQLSQAVLPNEGVMTITINPDNPSRMLVDGFEAYGALDGYVKNGRLYIPTQYCWTNTYYNQEVWFTNWTVQNGEYEEDGETKVGYQLMAAPDGYEFYFTLTDDGIQAGDIDGEKWNNHLYTDAELLDLCCIACDYMPSNTSGYFWMCFGVKGTVFRTFEFIEDQWKYLGDADFCDAWFPIFWEQTPEYPVPLYYDKSQTGRYLLYDPYGYGGAENNPYVYYGLNLSDKPGYLIFNIADPECVVFEPYVYSITINQAENPGDVLPVEFFNLNNEGYNFFIQHATTEEIIVLFEQNGVETSWLENRTNTVHIYNAIFNLDDNFSMIGTWGNDFPMEGYVVLPSNYMDGVDSVLGDDTDATPVYYNLQGVRVANPEKGQLLIVKKGNTTTKQIIR